MCFVVFFFLFVLLFSNAGDFIDTPPPPLPTHPAGPAHLAGMSRTRDNFFCPATPRLCLLISFILLFFFFFLCFVRFTVSREF